MRSEDTLGFVVTPMNREQIQCALIKGINNELDRVISNRNVWRAIANIAIAGWALTLIGFYLRGTK